MSDCCPAVPRDKMESISKGALSSTIAINGHKSPLTATVEIYNIPRMEALPHPSVYTECAKKRCTNIHSSLTGDGGTAAIMARQFCAWLKNPAVVDTREMSWGCSCGWSVGTFQIFCACCLSTTGAPLAVMFRPMLVTVGPCRGAVPSIS
jgi:hypothetical protein